MILIDEYDTPLNKAKSDADRDELQKLYMTFFRVVKAMGSDIQLTYVTGVNRVGLTDIYGGANHLADLTDSSEYTTLCDTTEAELRALAAHYSPGVDYTSAQLIDLKKKVLRRIQLGPLQRQRLQSHRLVLTNQSPC